MVLDGQQRLTAIHSFAKGTFPVDGSIQPDSDEIADLDGLYFHQLPEKFVRRFNRFTIRVFELIEFLPEEPYELFYRLNQPTALTSAEQRNAFFGPPRAQVKDLTRVAESNGMTKERVGFRNSRLAYEDIVARFVVLLERGTIKRKLTAGDLANRYRSGKPFANSVVEQATRAIESFFPVTAFDVPEIRLNKATAQSWLYFTAQLTEFDRDRADQPLADFVLSIEKSRHQLRRSESSEGEAAFPAGSSRWLVEIFNDRATSRVSDSLSVRLRDASLWLLWSARHPAPPEVLQLHAAVDRRLEDEGEILLSQAVTEVGWGDWL